MIRKLTRISPASCLAMVALFVALGGVSYAAVGQIGTSEIKNGAVTKKKLRKNAVVTNKIRNEAVTGAKVDESTLGIVPDAAKLAGKDPSAFESKAFGGEGDTAFVNLPKSATTTVRTQALPAGTYLIVARGGVNNNSAAIVENTECTLAAGGVSQTIGFNPLAKTGEPGDREEFSLVVVASLATPGDAVLSCKTTSSWNSGNVTDPTIAAISVQP